MQRQIITAIIFLTSMVQTFGQGLTLEEAFGPKMPARTDTFYFPFYNGVQMIEVDHLGFWDKKIFFLEQSQPRAMPHSMFHPEPLGNEYFFRDTTGKIVKAYNTYYSLEELTRHFANIPIDKKSSGLFALFSTHSFRSKTEQGIWVYSPQSMFLFNGYYKISNYPALTTRNPNYETNNENDIFFGLIDTFGNVKIPIQYKEILPLNENLIVSQNGKWGLININQEIIVPMQYDRFDNFYSDPQYNKFIYFMNEEKYVAIYKIKENSLVAIDSFERVHDTYLSVGYFLVEKKGLFGLIDLNGQLILPAIYNRINNVSRPDCIYKNCVSVVKDGKTYDLELKK